MSLSARDWANYTVDDFAFSFVDRKGLTVSIEIFLKQRDHDRFLTTVFFISTKSKLADAIADATSWARSVVRENIVASLRLREREIGPRWQAFDEDC